MTPSCILKVALPTPLRRLFDYLPPASTPRNRLVPGARVRVPFGKRRLTGFIIEVTTHTEVPAQQLKPALELLDEEPLIDASLLAFYRWCSTYYQHALGETLATALPTPLLRGEQPPAQVQTCIRLTPRGCQLPDSELQRAPRQAEIVACLKDHAAGLAEPAFKARNFSAAALNALLSKGLVEKTRRPQKAPRLPEKLLAQAPLPLNSEQQQAVSAIRASGHRFHCFLLDGVTGSGKTEVYLHSISHMLTQGRAVLLLVPEIGLTPQTVSRFEQRFNVPVATLHSGLTDNQRLHTWAAAVTGHAPIIIGTRSAVFTPIKNLGLIIVDEEHDLSFKQQDGLRYHARDVAVMRASRERIPVILGSATPALESLHNANCGRYHKLGLPRRAGNARAPRFELIDIRSRPLQDGFSQPLVRLIRSHLEAGNQVLVFLNRRGFAPALMCHSCGWIANCKRCETRFTLHQQPRQLRCHHCDSQRPVPAHCPDCGHNELNRVGVGTERSEAFLTQQFPETPVLRIDRDSTRRKNALADMVQQIQTGAPCLLVGTQMLAKGHHFPDVTLVAILDADGGFFSADFRGLERMSQLITQVAGRAGRASKPGTVAIQTHQADHPLLQCLVHEGYASLATILLAERQQAELPPYRHAALLRAEAAAETAPFDFLACARELAEKLTDASANVELFGPIPAVMFKRAGRYRAQLMLQSRQRKSLLNLLKSLCPALEKRPEARKVRWSVDVDPQESF